MLSSSLNRTRPGVDVDALDGVGGAGEGWLVNSVVGEGVDGGSEGIMEDVRLFTGEGIGSVVVGVATVGVVALRI